MAALFPRRLSLQQALLQQPPSESQPESQVLHRRERPFPKAGLQVHLLNPGLLADQRQGLKNRRIFIVQNNTVLDAVTI